MPNDKFGVTPNSDPPYSYPWLDLRAEPMILTTPEVKAGRHYSAPLIDPHARNFACLGTRSNGNDGAHFLIAALSMLAERQRSGTTSYGSLTVLGRLPGAIHANGELHVPAPVDHLA